MQIAIAGLVIPEAAARGCPESIATIVSMDSGLSLREPRNDEKGRCAVSVGDFQTPSFRKPRHAAVRNP